MGSNTFLSVILLFIAMAGSNVQPMKFPVDYYSSIQARKSFQDTIIEHLESLREQMKEGFPSMNLPPLDPFVLPFYHFSTGEGTSIQLTANFSDVIAKGLAGFIIDNVRFNLLSMKFILDLTFPELSVEGHYHVDGKLVVLPVYGQGPFVVRVQGSKVGGTASLTIKPGRIVEVEKLDLRINHGKLYVRLDGFLGGGDLSNEFHELINDLGDRLLIDFMPDLIHKYTETIREKVNGFLKDIDLSSVIG